VVICHHFITEADAGIFYYFSSAIRCGKIFTACYYRSAILYNTFYQPAGNNPIACIHDHSSFRLYGSSTGRQITMPLVSAF